jgi:hypothetical protein
MFKIISLLFFIMLNSVVGASVAVAAGFSPESGVIVANVVSFIPQAAGVLSVTLYKQIWLADIMESFIPNRAFLSAVSNMDQFVENDKINLAEAGVDPTVLINNSSYPVAFAERSDTPLELVLDVYDTTGTVIRNAEIMELAYDKRSSVIAGHKNALLTKLSQRAIHAYAPASNDAYTPVLPTTGTVKDTFKMITFNDILTLKTALDNLDAPDDRVLVLNPTHYNQLAMQDLVLMKAILQGGERLFGFQIFTFSRTPVYNKTTGVKAAFGAGAAPSTDTIASVAFCASEVMRALGTFDMFERLNDPEQKGDIINFQMRAVALPKRTKMIASVYSAAEDEN